MMQSRFTRHRTLRRALCLALCIATWRGPVIWVHEHSGHSAAGPKDVRFVEHLQRFHHGKPEFGEKPTWHFHIGLLRDLLGGDCDDESPGPSPTDEPINVVEASAPATASLVALHHLHGEPCAFLMTAPSAIVPDSLLEVPVGSFLQSFNGAPLCALIGVARC
jgi:hypothetical protein